MTSAANASPGRRIRKAALPTPLAIAGRRRNASRYAAVEPAKTLARIQASCARETNAGCRERSARGRRDGGGSSGRWARSAARWASAAAERASYTSRTVRAAVTSCFRRLEITCAARSELPPRSRKKSSATETAAPRRRWSAKARATRCSTGLRGATSARSGSVSGWRSGSADRSSLPLAAVAGNSATKPKRAGIMCSGSLSCNAACKAALRPALSAAVDAG